MKSKWTSGKIAAVIGGSLAGGVVLAVLLFFSVFFTVRTLILTLDRVNRPEESRGEESRIEEGREESRQEADAFLWEKADSDYYDFHNEIRDDLSYQVRIEEHLGQGLGSNVTSKMTYPVLQGEDETKIEIANRAIQAELKEVDDYLIRVSDTLEMGQEYTFEGDCYVTYMDEQILSIAYWEEGMLDGRTQEVYLIAVNLDMESGFLLTNSQILEIDEAFAIDFRKRSEEQNGADDYLDMYSDQDIMELLNSDESLIIFYTPLGMEVGVNHYGGWVTVTYRDYEKYLRKF